MMDHYYQLKTNESLTSAVNLLKEAKNYHKQHKEWDSKLQSMIRKQNDSLATNMELDNNILKAKRAKK
jgi:hypothetical protein